MATPSTSRMDNSLKWAVNMTSTATKVLLSIEEESLQSNTHNLLNRSYINKSTKIITKLTNLINIDQEAVSESRTDAACMIKIILSHLFKNSDYPKSNASQEYSPLLSKIEDTKISQITSGTDQFARCCTSCHKDVFQVQDDFAVFLCNHVMCKPCAFQRFFSRCDIKRFVLWLCDY